MVHGDCSHACTWQTLLELHGKCLVQVGKGAGMSFSPYRWQQVATSSVASVNASTKKIRVLGCLRGRKGKRRWSHSSKWHAWSWPGTDAATTAADVGPGQVSLGMSDLAQDIPVPAEALKNTWRAATPWIHWKLRVMEIGGEVYKSLQCTLNPEGKWKTHAWKNISWQLQDFHYSYTRKQLLERKYVPLFQLWGLFPISSKLLHLFPNSTGQEHLYV